MKLDAKAKGLHMFGKRKRKPPVITRPNDQRPRGGQPYSSGERNFEVDQERPAKCCSGTLGKVLILGAAAAGFGASAHYDVLLGQIGSVLMGLSTLHGNFKGGLRKSIMLPATAIVLWYLYSNPDVVAPLVGMVGGASGPFANAVGCAVVAGVVLFMIGMPVKFVRNRVVRKRPVLAGMDRFFGSTIGFAEGGVLMALLMWTAVLLEPMAQNTADHPDAQVGQKKIANTVLRLTKEIDESPLAGFAREGNLLAEIPEVKQHLDAIRPDGTIDPEKIDPSIQNMIAEMMKGMDPAQVQKAAEQLGLPQPGR